MPISSKTTIPTVFQDATRRNESESAECTKQYMSTRDELQQSCSLKNEGYKHIVIVAGEESGDFHASRFINELKRKHNNFRFSGIGGRHMEAAGVEIISDVARYAVTGITEVISHFNIFRKAFKTIQKYLTTTKPDLLILVDYPTFNLRLAKFAKKKLGIKILYYISPQIWAWKAGRIKHIKQYIDHMAVILPFEKNLYQKAEVPVSFVGHPLVNEIPSEIDFQQIRYDLHLPLDKKIIAFLPGSRMNEIKRHMPVLKEAANRLSSIFKDLHLVIPVAATINPSLIETYLTDCNLPYTLISEHAVEAAACSDVVIVASGTASLECALLIKPMCIIYKVSLLTAIVAAKVIKVRYLGLCNLLQNEMIVPELLQYDCNPKELTLFISELLTNQDTCAAIKSKLKKLKNSLSQHAADTSIESLIEQLVLL